MKKEIDKEEVKKMLLTAKELIRVTRDNYISKERLNSLLDEWETIAHNEIKKDAGTDIFDDLDEFTKGRATGIGRFKQIILERLKENGKQN